MGCQPFHSCFEQNCVGRISKGFQGQPRYQKSRQLGAVQCNQRKVIREGFF